MIFKEESQIEVVSNTDESDDIKIIVDLKKSSKLFSILLDNYKNARAAILREYTSNSWDAHKEINSDEPVIINIDSDDGGDYIEFVDKGIGMTDTFIKKTFSQLLKSTKSSSNEQIGMFGIGSKCGLAYTDQFNITTVKDGFKNQYLVYREGTGSPVITPMSQERCNDHSGTTIKIYIKDERVEDPDYRWGTISQTKLFAQLASKELSFFDNVIFNFKGYEINQFNSSYNGGKILEGNDKEGKTLWKFRTSSQYSDEFHIVLGKVCYAIDWKEIGLEPIKVAVGVVFELGAFMVNLTRESIIYSDESKKVIRDRVLLVKQSLIDEYNKRQIPVEGLFEYIIKRDFENRTNKYHIKFVIPNVEFPDSPFTYVIDVTDLHYDEIKASGDTRAYRLYNLNPLVYAPIAHLPIKLQEEVPYFFMYIRGGCVIDGREKKTPKSNKLQYYYDNQEYQIFSNGTLTDNKEFRKYVQNAVFIGESNIGYHRRKDLDELCESLGIKKQLAKGFNKNTNLDYFIYPCGTAKVIAEYKAIIRREVYKALNVVDFRGFEVPVEWKLEQKRLAKFNKIERPKLEGVIPYKDIIKDYQGELKLAELQNFKGLIFYGFMKDKSKLEALPDLFNCLKSFRKIGKVRTTIKDRNYYHVGKISTKALNIFRIAQGNEKLLKTIPNTIYIEDFMKNSNRVLNKLMTGYAIKEKYGSIINDRYALSKFEDLNPYIYDKLKELKAYYEIFDDSVLSDFKLSYSEIYEELKEINLANIGTSKEFVDLSIKPVLNILDNFFEDCELLFSIDYEKENINLIPSLVKYLKDKGKKVNVKYYFNRSVEQIDAREVFVKKIKELEESLEDRFVNWNTGLERICTGISRQELVDKHYLSKVRIEEDSVGFYPSLPDEFYNENLEEILATEIVELEIPKINNLF